MNGSGAEKHLRVEALAGLLGRAGEECGRLEAEEEGGAYEEGEMQMGDAVLEERGGERLVWPYPSAGGGYGIGGVMDVSWRLTKMEGSART